jgi:hypothetical protein
MRWDTDCLKDLRRRIGRLDRSAKVRVNKRQSPIDHVRLRVKSPRLACRAVFAVGYAFSQLSPPEVAPRHPVHDPPHCFVLCNNYDYTAKTVDGPLLNCYTRLQYWQLTGRSSQAANIHYNILDSIGQIVIREGWCYGCIVSGISRSYWCFAGSNQSTLIFLGICVAELTVLNSLFLAYWWHIRWEVYSFVSLMTSLHSSMSSTLLSLWPIWYLSSIYGLGFFSCCSISSGLIISPPT